MKTIYLKQTGEIVGVVSGNSSAHDNEEEGFVDGSYDALEYKIVNGVAVEKTDAEKQLYNDIRNAETIDSLRNKRNSLLSQSDWTQMPDSPVTDSKKTEWATYRQQLRDLPANTSDPSSPNYPSPPS